MRNLFIVGFFLLQLGQGEIRRVAGGVITGEVRALDGTPIGGVRVSALAIPEPNKPVDPAGVALMSFGETDSSGHYRLDSLPSGRYYIAAGLLGFPTYYPGVKDLTGARAIAVTSGETVSGVNFKLTRPVAGVRVSGRMTGLPAGMPSGLIKAALQPATPGVIEPEAVIVLSDGTFEFTRVFPGVYDLHCTAALGPFNPLYAAQRLRIEVDDVDIRVAGVPLPPLLFGRVVMDDGSKLPVHGTAIALGSSAPPAPIRLAARNQDRMSGPIAVSADGFFLVPATADWQLSATWLLFGYYVKSISKLQTKT